MNRILKIALGAIAALSLVILGAVVFGGGQEATHPRQPASQEQPADQGQQGQQPDSGDGGAGAPVPQEDSEPDEADDVTSFQLVDRSSYGVPDVRIAYKITNHSSEPSDYEITYDIVDTATGERVENDWVTELGVDPGQSVTGEYTTLLEEYAGHELKIVDVERTIAYE